MYNTKYADVVRELDLHRSENEAFDYAIEAVQTLEKIKRLMELNNVEGRHLAGTGTDFEEELIKLLRSRKYD